MLLSEEQTEKIAKTIMYDIPQYIIEHQEEYKNFLETETKTEVKRNEL